MPFSGCLLIRSECVSVSKFRTTSQIYGPGKRNEKTQILKINAEIGLLISMIKENRQSPFFIFYLLHSIQLSRHTWI